MAAALPFSRQQKKDEGEDEGVVVLRCFDRVKVAVPVALARHRSGLVEEALVAGERVVDVARYVSGPVVAKVVAYWEARAAAEKAAETFDDGEFLRGLHHDVRVDLIHAAHHLGDTALFDLFKLGAAR